MTLDEERRVMSRSPETPERTPESLRTWLDMPKAADILRDYPGAILSGDNER
jgi:hypothetical protein